MLTNPYFLIPIIIATCIWLFFLTRPMDYTSTSDAFAGLDVMLWLVSKVFYTVPYLLFWIIVLGIKACNAS